MEVLVDEEREHEEPSHPWARDDLDYDFDWDEERGKQALEGPRWVENNREKEERLRSIQK
jgi:hypothetical protein